MPKKNYFSAIAPGSRKPHSPHPPMDPHVPPVEGEDFVHIENPIIVENLSKSIVHVEEPLLRDNDACNEVVFASNEVDTSEQRKILPKELSRSVLVRSCDSAAEGGVYDVYLVGTAQEALVQLRGRIKRGTF